ncbi:FecR family protein [Caulobacter soli]|uniref:FecR family protein n=1 Tax=Caulobacter soli TaxID=2708539 RepID=UPI0013EB7331|nr:FecR domain-containing protein [Caulobacter soli]
MSANDNDLSVMEEAADWIDRLDELSDAERRELAVWLNASSDHAAAFAALRHTLRDTALLEAVDRLRAEPTEPLAPSPRRHVVLSGWSRAGLIAAGVLVLVGGGFLGSRLVTERAAPPIELATALGVRADHVLSDTSTVRLNADSHASVAYSHATRDIYLRRGDAVFEVAKNRHRPFNVMAGDAKVTAVGTVFEVDKVDSAVEVRVFEGVVRVSQGGAPPRTLRQGEWLLLASDHTSSRGRLAADSYDAWRGDWLEADNMPLKYVVARLNRYSPQALTLRDPRMGDLQVTGRFKLNKPAEALAMITSLLDLKVEKAGPRTYLAPPAPPPRSGRAI